MIRLLLVATLLASTSAGQTQTFAPPRTPAPAGPEMPSQGILNGAYVSDVVIRTQSESGPFTAFLIRPSGRGSTPEWFYIRNDNVAKALERGAMIGLLMGAAQANRWVVEGPARYVNIEYATVSGRKEITSASLAIQIR